MEAKHKLYDKGKKVEVLEELGEVVHNGRTYKLARERMTFGREYISIKLYNEKGRFIKRFAIDPDAVLPIAIALGQGWLVQLSHDQALPKLPEQVISVAPMSWEAGYHNGLLSCVKAGMRRVVVRPTALPKTLPSRPCPVLPIICGSPSCDGCFIELNKELFTRPRVTEAVIDAYCRHCRKWVKGAVWKSQLIVTCPDCGNVIEFTEPKRSKRR